MKVALIQLNAGESKKQNLEQAFKLTGQAISAGAGWVLLPEVFHYRGFSRNFSEVAEPIPGPSTKPLMDLAKQHKVFILAGSVYEKSAGQKKVYNTSVVINPAGKISAKYRKINLFKAALGKSAVNEEQNILSGKQPVVVKIGEFNVGLSVCYDLRFPELYKKYFEKNCHVIVVPSAFTKRTGQAHWEVLLRARAIENLCYVLAPNQVGEDPKGIASYGHSMAVSPWGEILAEGSGETAEIVYAYIDMEAVKAARKILPGICRKPS